MGFRDFTGFLVGSRKESFKILIFPCTLVLDKELQVVQCRKET